VNAKSNKIQRKPNTKAKSETKEPSFLGSDGDLLSV